MQDDYGMLFLDKLKEDLRNPNKSVNVLKEENVDYLEEELKYIERTSNNNTKNKSLNESILLSMLVAGGISAGTQILMKMWKNWQSKKEIRKVWMNFLTPNLRTKMKNKDLKEQKKIFSQIYSNFRKEKRGASFLTAAQVKEKIKSANIKKYWNQLVKAATAGKLKKYGLPILSVAISMAAAGVSAGLLTQAIKPYIGSNEHLKHIFELIKYDKSLKISGGVKAIRGVKATGEVYKHIGELTTLMRGLETKAAARPFITAATTIAAGAGPAIGKVLDKIGAPLALIKGIKDKRLQKKIVKAEELMEILAVIGKISKEKIYTAVAIEIMKYHGTLPLNNPQTPKAQKVYTTMAEFVGKDVAAKMEREFKKMFNDAAVNYID